MPRGILVKRDGLPITVERRGTSSRIALRHLCHPGLQVRSARDHTGRDGPQRCGFQGSDSQNNQDCMCPQVPTEAPFLITPEEPWALITVGGQSIDFLLDTGATYSDLTEAPSPLSSQSASKMGSLDEPKGITSVFL